MSLRLFVTHRAMVEGYELPERRFPFVPTVRIEDVGCWAKQFRSSVEGEDGVSYVDYGQDWL